MKTFCKAASGAALAFAAAALGAVEIPWKVPPQAPGGVVLSAYRGETIALKPDFGSTNISANAIYYQTNGMGGAWWQTDGLRFAPSNDCGAAAYRFFVSAADGEGRCYRANGTLRMLDSPGAVPNGIDLPARVVDFAEVEALNAPWLLPEATNALVAAEEEERRWSAKGAWTFRAVPVAATNVSEVVAAATNSFGCISLRRQVRRVMGGEFRFEAVRLDPFRCSDALDLSYSHSGSFASNGTYRISATDARTLRTHVKDIYIHGVNSTETFEESTYADDALEWRRWANRSEAITNLASGAAAEHGTAGYEPQNGYPDYTVRETFRPKLALPGWGINAPVFVAPGFVASAAHWKPIGGKVEGDFTISTPELLHPITVRIGRWIRLRDWALAHGFTAEECARVADFGDLAVAPIESEVKVPAALCPYIASEAWIAEHFGSLEGLVAWQCLQGSASGQSGNELLWAVPCVLKNGHSWVNACNVSSATFATDFAKQAIGLGNAKNWPIPHSGDSGKPVFLHGEAFPGGGSGEILISTYRTAATGPDYSAALPMLKAYAESLGTTLKTLE